MWHKDASRAFAQGILSSLRQHARNSDLNFDRLPPWLESADIRIGRLPNSTIIVFEGNGKDSDSVVEYQTVNSDIEFLTGASDFRAESAVADLTGEFGSRSVMMGEITEEGEYTNLHIQDGMALTNAGHVIYHRQHILVNVLFHLESNEGETLATRLVPFAIYVHDEEIKDPEAYIRRGNEGGEQTLLEVIHSSQTGDYYQSRARETNAFLTKVEDSVIVLGDYENNEEVLYEVRDSLRSKGYDANLIKDLAGVAHMSLTQKVKMWSLAARFCVMVDIDPSGHIREYGDIVNSLQKVLILFQPTDSGSTWMIANEQIVDVNYVRKFEFESTPLEKMDEAIKWAEEYLDKRREAYDNHYEWRNGDS